MGSRSIGGVAIRGKPHESQLSVARHGARFRVLSCGRRWGKTVLGVTLACETAQKGGRAWWVAPTYPIAGIGWRQVRQLASLPGFDKNEVDRRLVFPSGGWVQVKSAHDPDSLRGEGLDFVVMDECAFIQERAWTEALRPALADRQGKALFISTPKGRNFFWRLWLRGQEDGDEWHSWKLPTADNPHIPPGEIEAARRNLPERVFQQEYLAEFIEDAGAVFRRVMDCAIADTQDGPVEGHEYLFGIDWGKHEDFTVIVVMDSTTKQAVYVDRFNQIDYAFQLGRLRVLAERFRPYCIIPELNSMGEPLVEQLQREGMPVQPFQTTNASKAQAIEALALAFERGDIGIIPDPVLVGELQAYEMERLPSGLMRYTAPSGLHDDTVMALALAWHGVGGADWYIW